MVTQVTNSVVSVGRHLTDRSPAPGLPDKGPCLYQPQPRWPDSARSFPCTHLVRSQEGLHPEAHAADKSTLSGRTRYAHISTFSLQYMRRSTVEYNIGLPGALQFTKHFYLHHLI